MIYLYAAVDDPGAAGPGLEAIGTGPVTLVGRYHAGTLPEPSPDALREHDAIVRRLMASCAVAPFRFATVVESEADAVTWLEQASETLAARLPILRGRVEVAVRAWSRPAPVAPRRDSDGGRPGRRYLQALAEQRGPGPLRQMHRTLSGHAVSAEARPWGPNGIKSSYLVDTASAPAFMDRVRQLGRAHPALTRVWATGPWAPYSFTGPDSPLATASGAGCG